MTNVATHEKQDEPSLPIGLEWDLRIQSRCTFVDLEPKGLS